MKKCYKCNLEKPKDNFSKNSSKKDGLNSWCKKCFKEYSLINSKILADKKKIYYSNNKNRIKSLAKSYYNLNKEKIRTIKHDKRRTTIGIAKELLAGVRRRSVKYNITFDLDLDFIIELVKSNSHCPITNEKFVVGNNTIVNNSRTIDRIVPDLGYVNSNIAIVSNLANKVKNNGTILDIEKVYKNLCTVEGLKEVSWIDKITVLKCEIQIFKGQYIRKSGKKVAAHSMVVSSMIRDAKRRAISGRYKYLLCRSDIVFPKICPLLGIPINRGKGKVLDTSPTIDKIIPEKGYISTNIQIISRKANLIKSNCTAEELGKIFYGYKNFVKYTKNIS